MIVKAKSLKLALLLIERWKKIVMSVIYQKMYLILVLLLTLQLECHADSVSWIKSIESGRPFQAIFDKTAGKFDDSQYTGESDPMGTLKGGETYTVTYTNGNFACTGYNQGAGEVGTWTYSNAKPTDNRISLWGRVYVFDGQDNLYDSQYGLVGHLALLPVPETKLR